MSKFFKSFFLFAFTIVNLCTVNAQSSLKDSSIAMFLVSPQGALFQTDGDLANRFGPLAGAGIKLAYKTKSNWIFSVDVDQLFSDKVTENSVVSNLYNSDGDIVDTEGRIADIRFRMRGFQATFMLGKIIVIGNENDNTGLIFQVGVGYLQHKIRIDNPGEAVPQLQGEYVKGYDRLTGGIQAKQFLGYQRLDNNNLLNFYVGLELIQGFTKGQRSFNYNTKSPDYTPRVDLMYGVRLGIILPFYSRAPDKYYYF
jgi:hypothetical protein